MPPAPASSPEPDRPSQAILLGGARSPWKTRNAAPCSSWIVRVQPRTADLPAAWISNAIGASAHVDGAFLGLSRDRESGSRRLADRLALRPRDDAEVGAGDQPGRDPEDAALVRDDLRARRQAVPVDLHHALPRLHRREVVASLAVRHGVGPVVEGHHGARYSRLAGVLPAVPVLVAEHLSDDRREVEDGVLADLDAGAGVSADLERALEGRRPVVVLAGEDTAADAQNVADRHALAGRQIERAEEDRPRAALRQRGHEVVGGSDPSVGPRPYEPRRPGRHLEPRRDLV